jgi:putative transposase
VHIVPRQRRWFFPGLSLHVVQRGNNRCDIFRADDDRRVFLWAVRRACESFRLDVHAYVLMTTHLHVVLTPGTRDALPKAIQFVGRCYVPYFNRRYGRTGGLFDGRYRAHHLHSEQYWLNAVRYVEMNPVRAGIVRHPAEYRWSSYRVHAFGDESSLIAPHAGYERLGPTPEERQDAWRTLCAVPLPDDQLPEFRMASSTQPPLSGDPQSDASPKP